MSSRVSQVLAKIYDDSNKGAPYIPVPPSYYCCFTSSSSAAQPQNKGSSSSTKEQHCSSDVGSESAVTPVKKPSSGPTNATTTTKAEPNDSFSTQVTVSLNSSMSAWSMGGGGVDEQQQQQSGSNHSSSDVIHVSRPEDDIGSLSAHDSKCSLTTSDVTLDGSKSSIYDEIVVPETTPREAAKKWRLEKPRSKKRVTMFQDASSKDLGNNTENVPLPRNKNRTVTWQLQKQQSCPHFVADDRSTLVKPKEEESKDACSAKQSSSDSSNSSLVVAKDPDRQEPVVPNKLKTCMLVFQGASRPSPDQDGSINNMWSQRTMGCANVGQKKVKPFKFGENTTISTLSPVGAKDINKNELHTNDKTGQDGIRAEKRSDHVKQPTAKDTFHVITETHNKTTVVVKSSPKTNTVVHDSSRDQQSGSITISNKPSSTPKNLKQRTARPTPAPSTGGLLHHSWHGPKKSLLPKATVADNNKSSAVDNKNKACGPEIELCDKRQESRARRRQDMYPSFENVRRATHSGDTSQNNKWRVLTPLDQQQQEIARRRQQRQKPNSAVVSEVQVKTNVRPFSDLCPGVSNDATEKNCSEMVEPERHYLSMSAETSSESCNQTSPCENSTAGSSDCGGVKEPPKRQNSGFGQMYPSFDSLRARTGKLKANKKWRVLTPFDQQQQEIAMRRQERRKG